MTVLDRHTICLYGGLGWLLSVNSVHVKVTEGLMPVQGSDSAARIDTGLDIG